MVQLDARFVRVLVLGLSKVNASVLWSLPRPQSDFVSSRLRSDAFRIEETVPQTAVPGTEAVLRFVDHRGAGGVVEAKAHGKPLVCFAIMWAVTESPPRVLDDTAYGVSAKAYMAAIALPKLALLAEKWDNTLDRLDREEVP